MIAVIVLLAVAGALLGWALCAAGKDAPSPLDEPEYAFKYRGTLTPEEIEHFNRVRWGLND